MKKLIFVTFFLCSYYFCYSQQKHNMNLIELIDGGYILYKKYKKEDFQVRNFVDNLPIAQEYKKEYGIDVYLGRDGKAYYSDSTNIYEFESIEILKKAVKEVFLDSSSREVLYKKKIYGVDFPKFSKSVATNLLKELNISSQSFNVKILKTVEESIASMANPYKFYRDNFLAVCALLGESLINEKNLKWKMILSDDQETWNLFLYSENEEIPFFVDVYEDIFINNEIEDVLSLNFYSVISTYTKSKPE